MLSFGIESIWLSKNNGDLGEGTLNSGRVFADSPLISSVDIVNFELDDISEDLYILIACEIRPTNWKN